MNICRGSAPVPTPAAKGNHGGIAPTRNYANDLGLLYNTNSESAIALGKQHCLFLTRYSYIKK
ncbi:MAG: hypothetical protein HC789_20135 [Microcoleus sp. CSU_2_2]|nr:hypothetical protein [Microcoleus sp. CSU_2_2]